MMRLIIAMLICSTSALFAGDAFIYPSAEADFKKGMESAKLRGITFADYHIHIRGGMTPEKASKRQEASGIQSGILENFGREWPLSNTVALASFIDSAKAVRANGKPLQVGIQVNDRDWYKQIDPEQLRRLDYVLADTMIMGVTAEGKPRRLWLPGVMIEDADAWMEEYMKHNLRVLGEPISILANPTYLPPCISNQYERLWTEVRMKQLISNAVENGVALEIQAGSAYPHERFLKLAKEMGAKFSFGSNNFDDKVKPLTRWFEAMESHDLTPSDLPAPKGPAVRE
jgi:hypothetical protein